MSPNAVINNPVYLAAVAQFARMGDCIITATERVYSHDGTNSSNRWNNIADETSVYEPSLAQYLYDTGVIACNVPNTSDLPTHAWYEDPRCPYPIRIRFDGPGDPDRMITVDYEFKSKNEERFIWEEQPSDCTTLKTLLKDTVYFRAMQQFAYLGEYDITAVKRIYSRDTSEPSNWKPVPDEASARNISLTEYLQDICHADRTPLTDNNRPAPVWAGADEACPYPTCLTFTSEDGNSMTAIDYEFTNHKPIY